jgi:multiple sugar transport system permease protein
MQGYALWGQRRQSRLIWFLLPSLIGFLALYIIPFILSFYYTMIDGVMTRNFIWFKGYLNVLSNPSFLLALKNTVIFILLAVPANMLLSFMAASLLKSARRFRLYYSVIFMISLVVPSGSVVFLWRTIFSLEGLLNKALLPFGHVPVDWLETSTALTIICLAFLWKNLGFNIVLFQAGLDGIPGEYYELARLEGASLWQIYWNITRVFLAPTTFLVLLMSIIHSFKNFKEVFALIGAYPRGSNYMLQQYMNNQFFNLDLTRLSTSAYILAAGITVVVWVLFYGQARIAHRFE